MLHWTRGIDADTGREDELDENVRRALPAGSTVISSTIFGAVAWARSSRIVVALADGTVALYFLKCCVEDEGRALLQGEFDLISEIAKHKPSLTPTPIAIGQLQRSSPPTTFFLMEFLEINTGAPKPSALCRELADLHAITTSHNGKFGYHVPTYDGPHPQNVSWESSWSIFFARLLQQFVDREILTNGPTIDGRYEAELETLINITTPLLLGALQSEGRDLKPSLVHGNLWQENAGTELSTGIAKIFDASGFYAHNEYELGMWRRPTVRFTRAHFREYLRHMPPSDPKEQWDDRIRLYSIKFELTHSISWAGAAKTSRRVILEDAGYLNEKYTKSHVNGIRTASAS